MGETLNEQCRVSDEGPLGKIVQAGNGLCLMVLFKKATANYVPAAAVIRRWRALSGFIGRKASADGLLSLESKPGA